MIPVRCSFSKHECWLIHAAIRRAHYADVAEDGLLGYTHTRGSPHGRSVWRQIAASATRRNDYARQGPQEFPAAHARLLLAPRRTPGRTSPPPRVPIFCRSLTPFPSVLVCPLKIRGAGRRDGLPHHAEGARTTRVARCRRQHEHAARTSSSRGTDNLLMPPGLPSPSICAAGGCRSP